MTDREIDCEIAKQVFGYDIGVKDDGIYQPFYYLEDASYSAVPSYTKNLNIAFQALERVQAKRKSKISIETYEGEIWTIKPCGVSSKSLPEAICKAILAHYASQHQDKSANDNEVRPTK